MSNGIVPITISICVKHVIKLRTPAVGYTLAISAKDAALAPTNRKTVIMPYTIVALPPWPIAAEILASGWALGDGGEDCILLTKHK